MSTIITEGIEISVKTSYFAQHSNPIANQYFFVYEISITNKSSYTVQLLSRHWDIVDGVGKQRTVDGDGVVGEQPVIEPNEKFVYNSGCDFETDTGKMYGYYTMLRLVDNQQFKVQIPEFLMVLPAKLN